MVFAVKIAVVMVSLRYYCVGSVGDCVVSCDGGCGGGSVVVVVVVSILDVVAGVRWLCCWL